MANRRVSELNELLNTQVAASDLFLITDISAVESKKIRASELQTYALNGTASYSLRSVTSSYSLIALSSSYSPATVSASYALSASYADWAKTASYVLSASYALSSSYSSMSFWAITASYALTSSVQLVISSGFSTYANTASYLNYTPGIYNGRISLADVATFATSSATSSYLLYTGIFNGSASYALTASRVGSASFATTASFLNYAGRPNGTASYAMSSSIASKANYIKRIMGWRTVTSTDILTDGDGRSNQARIYTMSLSSNETQNPETYITATGNVWLSYTSSVSASLQLYVHNQTSNVNTLFDYLPIVFQAGGNLAGSVTGSINYPFTLQGPVYPAGNLPVGAYTVVVSASSGLSFDLTRPIKYRIESEADTLSIGL